VGEGVGEGKMMSTPILILPPAFVPQGGTTLRQASRGEDN